MLSRQNIIHNLFEMKPSASLRLESALPRLPTPGSRLPTLYDSTSGLPSPVGHRRTSGPLSPVGHPRTGSPNVLTPSAFLPPFSPSGGPNLFESSVLTARGIPSPRKKSIGGSSSKSDDEVHNSISTAPPPPPPRLYPGLRLLPEGAASPRISTRPPKKRRWAMDAPLLSLVDL